MAGLQEQGVSARSRRSSKTEYTVTGLFRTRSRQLLNRTDRY
jgi:hypothetical protein